MKKIQIPEKAKVRVHWEDLVENYSKEGENRVKSSFAKKYGISKEAISVIFNAVRLDKKGNRIEVNGASIENILDQSYQRQLFKEWLEREKKDVDFTRLIALDDKVNAEINIKEEDVTYRKWKLEKLWIDNFLSYGDGNEIDFTKLNGITSINSLPQNQGGKSTFAIDAPLFLLYGVTTKSDRNEQIFNQYRDDSNQVKVKGIISLDSGERFAIQRLMKRGKKKDGSGFNITNTVSFYEIMPDGEERELVGEYGAMTTKKIVELIGTKEDFLTTILTTGDNLGDLLDTMPTERGKLLTRFIGLDVIELKEEIAKKMYSEFEKTMKSNTYNILDLTDELVVHNNNLKEIEDNLKTDKLLLEEYIEALNNYSKEKDVLLTRKQNIDNDVINLDPAKLNREITEITNKGKEEKVKFDGFVTKINEIGDVKYDLNNHDKLIKEKRTLELDKTDNEREVVRLNKLNVDYTKPEHYCPHCKKSLDGIDYEKAIEENKKKVIELEEKNKKLILKIEELSEEINKLNKDKTLFDDKNKYELSRDRSEVEINGLRNSLFEKRNNLKKYELNNEMIELNKQIDIDVLGVNAKIQMKEIDKTNTDKRIQKAEIDKETNEKEIVFKSDIIKIITKEQEIEKIFKVYVDMVGKKGISKLVLRSVLPIINAELVRLLDDICDFTVELEINNKNDVEFVMSSCGVKKLLKSGSGFEKTAATLALRAVLGKICNLPKPNFIAFDEVLVGVAKENMENIKLLFDKFKEMFDIILLISHDDLIKDWGERCLVVTKENNISTFSYK